MDNNLLFITATELIRVRASSLVYIAADGNYSVLTTSDGSKYTLTLQLGQIEKRISEMSTIDESRFIRIGKSLIVNQDYIVFINPSRQKLILSDCQSFRYEVSASRDALKILKEYLETEK